MYSTSDTFSAAVAGPHTVVVRADLWRAGKPIATMPDRVLGGSITIDRNAAVRGRCSVTLLDPPASLNPFGDELAIYRGVQFDDGTTEWVPCGVYGITSIEWAHTADHAVAQCEAMDRADALAKKRWSGPWVITRGTLISDAIEAIVNDRLPGNPTRITGTAHRTPQTVHDGANATPLDVVTELAKAAGLDVWFDRDGTFVAAPPATANDPVVATFREGPTSTVGAVTRRLQADPGANGVIVVGSSTQAEPDIWAAAWDDNPASPTYRRGPFGERPVYLGSTNVLSVEQARQVAVTELARLTASTVSLAFDTPANPALDAGDRVRVVRDASGVDDVIVVDTITLPLTLDGAMRVGAEQAIHALAARISAQASTPQIRRLGRLRSVEGDTATVEIGGQEVDAPLPAADVPPSDPILPDPDPAADPPADPSAPPEEPYYDPYIFPTVIVPGDEIGSGEDSDPAWLFEGDGTARVGGATIERDVDGNAVMSITEEKIILWAKGDATPDNDALLELDATSVGAPGGQATLSGGLQVNLYAGEDNLVRNELELSYSGAVLNLRDGGLSSYSDTSYFYWSSGTEDEGDSWAYDFFGHRGFHVAVGDLMTASAEEWGIQLDANNGGINLVCSNTEYGIRLDGPRIDLNGDVYINGVLQ